MSRKVAVSSVEGFNRALDEKYFISLYEDLHPELITYGIKICRDEDMVLDSIHEVFLNLWENKQKLARIRDLKPYILRALRNQIVSCVRAQRKFSPTEFFKEEISFDISQEAIMIKIEDQEINAKKVKNLLTSLTDHQREVIFLKYYSGLSDQQIAGVTGMKYQSVRNHLSKSLKKLKDTIHFILLLVFIQIQ
jgi:RNA polymerase sigma factor (sigma-70 family)